MVGVCRGVCRVQENGQLVTRNWIIAEDWYINKDFSYFEVETINLS